LRPGELEIVDGAHGARHAVRVVGELDLATAPQLEANIEQLCGAGAEEIEIDLAGLAFIDSTGLRALLIAQELCKEHGCEFFLLPGPDQVQRLFELTGLLERLPLRETRSASGDDGAALARDRAED
jgi:anti-sigma B factor antagonist